MAKIEFVILMNVIALVRKISKPKKTKQQQNNKKQTIPKK